MKYLLSFLEHSSYQSDSSNAEALVQQKEIEQEMSQKTPPEQVRKFGLKFFFPKSSLLLLQSKGFGQCLCVMYMCTCMFSVFSKLNLEQDLRKGTSEWLGCILPIF